MLHPSWQDDDVACGIGFRSLIASALAVALKDDNHFLSLVEMPGDRYTWTDDILVDVRQRTQLFVGDEIANTPFRPARSFAQHRHGKFASSISSLFERPTILLKAKFGHWTLGLWPVARMRERCTGKAQVLKRTSAENLNLKIRATIVQVRATVSRTCTR